MSTYKSTSLWKNAFDSKNDGLDNERKILVTAYDSLRDRVKALVSHIHVDMPHLTVHDITHIDALWGTASTISGENFPLNPAEAFVLGGAFLLHDAAHCMAAFPKGLEELKETDEWLNVCNHYGIDPSTVSKTSEKYNHVVFDVLRKLHPKKAKELLHIQWQNHYLLEHAELRKAYGHIIGEIAESHWWNPHELEKIKNHILTCPAFLKPAAWSIDKLKVAILLRTADAAHIDSERAPLFLMALRNPQGTSRAHWTFQNKMNAAACNQENNELYITSSPFTEAEQDAWWLAFDTAQLINKELQAADRLLVENRNNNTRLQARNFYSSTSPDIFARHVPTEMWHPVDASIKITNLKKMVENFGGSKLYGDQPMWALREILQNAIDAIHAARAINALQNHEGSIEISLEEYDSQFWLHITDTGIGMSKFVLTDVLLDFGRSLWDDKETDREWENLSNKNFKAIGQFGIGFFSIFMLGEKVRVVTRRHDTIQNEPTCWTLVFNNGLNSRPLLRQSTTNEKLSRSGTRVSVLIKKETLEKLCISYTEKVNTSYVQKLKPFSTTCAHLAPAIDIDLIFKEKETLSKIVSANDWKTIPIKELLSRIYPARDPINEKFISDIKDEDGKIIGRATTTSNQYGIGVINGIYAGNVNGLYGIINCNQQSDLARKTASPKIKRSELKKWAEEQKEIRIKNGIVNTGTSIILIAFGAKPENLYIAENSKGKIEHAKYLEIIKSIDSEPIVLHQGKIEWDENDDVTKTDFEYYFKCDESILITPRHFSINWLNELVARDGDNFEEFYEFFYTNEADGVGPDYYSEKGHVCVGEVNGYEISRYCILITKHSDDA